MTSPVRAESSAPLQRAHQPAPDRLRSLPGRCEQLDPGDVDAMLSAARRIVQSEDLAWDAVQVVLTRLWERGRLSTDPRPVLRSLTRKAALQLLRTERRRASAESLACPVCGEDIDDHGPFDAACRSEVRQTLAAALGAIPTEQRRAFELCVVGDVGYAVAARHEGVPIGTIRSRVHRARLALQERLGRDLGWDELPVQAQGPAQGPVQGEG